MNPLRWVYIVCCPFSILGSLFIIITYGLYNELKKPGANFIFFQAMCDLAFTSKYVITVVLEQIHFNEYDPNEPFSWECVLMGWLGQFAGHATCAWNFMMSILVFHSFRSAEQYKGSQASLWKYHTYVWSVSLFMSVYLLIDGQYGPTSDGCWIKGDENKYRYIFFFGPYSFYIIACVAVLLYITYKLYGSGLKTYNKTGKLQFIHQLQKYVLIFVLFWSPPIFLRIVEAADAVCLALQGFANSLVWASSPQFRTLLKAKFSTPQYQELNS